MFTFIFNHWHAWQNTQGRYMLSDENTKRLHSFATLDGAINYLFLHGERDAARALNAAKPPN